MRFSSAWLKFTFDLFVLKSVSIWSIFNLIVGIIIFIILSFICFKFLISLFFLFISFFTVQLFIWFVLVLILSVFVIISCLYLVISFKYWFIASLCWITSCSDNTCCNWGASNVILKLGGWYLYVVGLLVFGSTIISPVTGSILL